MIELNRFSYLACFEALNADANSFRSTIDYGANHLKVGHETPSGYAGYFLSDTAFTFGQSATHYGSAGNRFFTANFAYS